VAVLEKFKTWARTIKRDVHAIYLTSGDPLVPWHAKALGVAVAAYARRRLTSYPILFQF